jgi:hypothetical protein
MSGEVWYSVGPKDVFPETFEPFLLGNPAVRAAFMAHHADLLDAAFWQHHKERIQAGQCSMCSRTKSRSASSTKATQRIPERPQFFRFSLRFHIPRRPPHVRIHRHRRRRPHPHGQLPGRLFHAVRARPGRRRHQGRRRARRHRADSVGEVLFGNCLMAGQGQAPARQAAYKGGLPDSAGAVTLSKMCGSAMKAAMLRTTCCWPARTT